MAFCRVDPREDPAAELAALLRRRRAGRQAASARRGLRPAPRRRARGDGGRRRAAARRWSCIPGSASPRSAGTRSGSPSSSRRRRSSWRTLPNPTSRGSGASSRIIRTSSSTPRGGTRPTTSPCSRYVPPGHILFGSDTPYGTTVAAAIVAMATALGTGLSPAQVEAVCGGQLRRLLDGEWAPETLDLGPAPGAPPPRSPLVERVFTLLVGSPGEDAHGCGERGPACAWRGSAATSTRVNRARVRWPTSPSCSSSARVRADARARRPPRRRLPPGAGGGGAGRVAGRLVRATRSPSRTA